MRVDVGGDNDALAAELGRRSLRAAVLDDASLEVTLDGHDGDAALDLVRDVVAELGLPLHSLSTRHTSLDEVFLRRAGEAG